MYVGVTTSAGSKLMLYYCGNGTNYLDGSGSVIIYLGSGAAASVWNRFERNIEEDWESLSAATWTNTDGLLIRPTNTASYDFYIDDIRFSNSRTKTHNTLSGGSIGQIVSAKNYMSNSYGQPEDVWYSYDHNGDVVNLSNSSGAKTTEYAQDAFGNVLSSATTGAWATSADGRHITTKEYDDNLNLYNFGLRWYDPEIGRFVSKDPMGMDNQCNFYLFCGNNPVNLVDPTGGCGEKPKPSPSPTPSPTPDPIPPLWSPDPDLVTPDLIRQYVRGIGPPPPLSSVNNPLPESNRCDCPPDVSSWVQSYCRALQAAAREIRDQYRDSKLIPKNDPLWNILENMAQGSGYSDCIRYHEDQYGCKIDYTETAE
jgi:RHS repeat-associated protein